MKPMWSGSLSFGLITIAIKLYSAIKPHTFGFRLLHTVCDTPLEYQRWCPRCKREVSWDTTVKGLEQDDGSFFIFTKETLEKLKPEKTDAISIISFVDAQQIQTIYLDEHYYVAPDKKAIKPFFLFQKALAQSGKVAIGRFVMREKEYMCCINPYESTLLLTTLHYAYEIKPIQEVFNVAKEVKVTKEELSLAYKLIDQFTKKTFDLEKYKDEFAEKVKKALKNKKRVTPKKQSLKTTKLSQKEDLVSLLHKSLGSNQRASYARAKR